MELKEHTLECIKDQHGNHVIQKCFTATPTRLMQLLIGPILCNVNLFFVVDIFCLLFGKW